MRDSLDAVVARCMLLGRGELAHLLAGARSHVKRNAAAIEGTRANPGSRLSEALPATSLITLAGEIDAIAPEFGLTLVEVVHDETSSFEPNLDWSFQVMSGSEPVDNPFEHVLPHGGRVRIGYSVVRTLRFAVSAEEPLVQAADILAALLATVPSEFIDGIDGTNPGLADEYAHLALLSDIGQPVPCHIVGSRQFRHDVTLVVGRSIQRQVEG